MFYLVTVGLDAWESGPLHLQFSSWVRKVWGRLGEVSFRLDEPVEWAWAAMTLLTVEGLVILLAWCLMNWAARPERVTDSFVRSLRRVWLLTPFAATVWLVLGVWVVGSVRLDALDAWEGLSQMAGVTAILSIALWTAMRAISVGRGAAGCESGGDACRWPAGCEACGYTLAASAGQATCPECGLPVAESLRDNPRVGTPWARRREVGRLRGWAATWFDAVFRPRRLGRRLQLLSRDTGRGSLLTIALGLQLLIGWAGSLGVIFATRLAWGDGRTFNRVHWVEMSAIGGGVGLVTMGAACGILLASASFVGTLVGSRAERNLLPAAMQASCCLGGLLAAWAVVGWIVLAGLMYLSWTRQLDAIAASLGADQDTLGMAVFGILGLIALAHWLSTHGRIVRAARYANR